MDGKTAKSSCRMDAETQKDSRRMESRKTDKETKTSSIWMDEKAAKSSRMDVTSPTSSGGMETRKTVKLVKFCDECKFGNECKVCDKTFCGDNQFKSTSYHQLKTDITSFGSKEMIVDLGCPNSVISRKDVHGFIKNLSKYQQNNLAIIRVDDKFKFGPSGPFQCSERLQFPITSGFNNSTTEVSIVEAQIPMLLGNNILSLYKQKLGYFPLNMVY